MTTTATAEATFALLTRFEKAFNPLDVDALMADMSEDTVFEHVAPTGAGLFPDFKLEIADLFASADRGTCRWSMTWRQEDGSEGSMRGCDVFRVRDGKIIEKLSYTA